MNYFLIALVVSSKVFAASMDTIDSECRIQAKETAISTYQSCVKDSRSQKIDEIRKEYQGKLNELKTYYDAEMKKMSLGQKSSAVDAQPTTAEITLKKKGKTATTKPNSLPAKKVQGKSLPVRSQDPEIKSENPAPYPTDETPLDSDVVSVDDGSI